MEVFFQTGTDQPTAAKEPGGEIVEAICQML